MAPRGTCLKTLKLLEWAFNREWSESISPERDLNETFKKVPEYSRLENSAPIYFIIHIVGHRHDYFGVTRINFFSKILRSDTKKRNFSVASIFHIMITRNHNQRGHLDIDVIATERFCTTVRQLNL